MTTLLLLAAHAAVPDDHQIGFGVGIVAPTGTFAPNTAGARVRLADALALEPTVDVSLSSAASGVDAGGVELDQRTSSRVTSLGLGFRFHAASRENLALVVSGTPFVTTSRAVTDPDVDEEGDETIGSGLAVGARWGVGAEFHPGGPWAISADLQNPLVSFGRSSTESPGDVVSVNRSFDVGLIFAPTVRFMAHLFF